MPLSGPAGSEYDEEEVDYEESDSDESWTTESAISSEAILSSMCMNGGEEKPFACPVPGCKKRYKVNAAAPHWHDCGNWKHQAAAAHFGSKPDTQAGVRQAPGLGCLVAFSLC